jgi:hypothetical protein
MKQTNDESMLEGMNLPDPGNPQHRQELKIPLLSYTKSSRAGLWLLTLPLLFALTILLKYRFGVLSPILNSIEGFFAYLSGNRLLTYLIPVIFVGLPLVAMIINFMAICHFGSAKEKRELLVTIKYRPLNIAIFFFSFAVLIYFILPDALP